MGKSSEWTSGANRRYILAAEDVPELERESAVNEFVQKRPRDEAESLAYTSYRRKHHVQAAAHHLAMMKAASASGSHKDAKKHSLVYAMHLKELGCDPNDPKVPQEVQDMMSDPDKNPGLRFKAHKGDAFLLNKSEEPIYIIPEWQLSPHSYTLKALTTPVTLKKSDAPLTKSASPLKVNFHTNKLRQMRDWFDQQGINSINEKEIPTELRQQLMRVGRDYGGNFHREAVQKLIDSAPPRDYNFSTGTYHTAVGAAQRHSKEDSNVFRLDMTPQQEQQMREAGVLDTYRRMQGLSQGAGHPAEDPTLGWVRWTGDKSGVHVDEVQSDFGRPWPAFFADQFNRLARRKDIMPHEIPRYVEHYSRDYPEEQRKIIQKIGFGNKHPAEVLHEAFQEWARTHGGLEGAPVHVWQPEAKAYMATVDPFYTGDQGDLATFDYTRPIPGHLQSAYRDIPVDKQGAVGGQYGEIPTQSTARFKKQPPKSATGKVGGDIQWRPSTKTYKDTIRGKDRTETKKMDLSDLKSLAKAAVVERMLGLIKTAREELVSKRCAWCGDPKPIKNLKDSDGVERPVCVDCSVNERAEKLGKGDVIPFPADRAKAAVVPPEQRNGKVAGTILPHRLRGQDDASLASKLDIASKMNEAGLIDHNDPGVQQSVRGMTFLQRLKQKQQGAAAKGHTSPEDANPPPTQKSELGKGMLGAMSTAGVAASPKGAASGQPIPPPNFGQAKKAEEKPEEDRRKETKDFEGKPKREDDAAWDVTPKTYKPWKASEKSASKPYTGRDEGIRTQKLAPGTPGANKQGVGVQVDRKKQANKESARKWKP